MRRFLTSAVLAFALLAAIVPAQSGALNGTRVIGDVPDWIARLQTAANGNANAGRCSGTLIDHEFVITAAHCVFTRTGAPEVTDPAASNWTVTVGMDDQGLSLIHI